MEYIKTLLALLLMIGIEIWHLNTYKRAYEKVDGVTTLEGIQYLVKDVDVDYVMYKLDSTCTSQILRKKEFERTGDMEGYEGTVGCKASGT